MATAIPGILLPQTGVTEFEGALLVCSVIAPVLLSALPHWLACVVANQLTGAPMKSVLFACLTWLATAPAYAFLEGFFEPVPDEVPLTDQRLKASQDGWDSLIPRMPITLSPMNPPSS